MVGRDFLHSSHTASYTMGTWSLLGVKWPGRGIDHAPSSTEIKERVQLYLYSTSGSSWPVGGWTLPLPTNCQNPEMWTHFEYVNPKLSTVCIAMGAKSHMRWNLGELREDIGYTVQLKLLKVVKVINRNMCRQEFYYNCYKCLQNLLPWLF
jgi:hypothetical protein